MSILAFPVPKLARKPGAKTLRRPPNWLRTAAVATTTWESSGSFDEEPSTFKLEDAKPALARSVHTWASHDTTTAELTCCIIHETAFARTAASTVSWLVWV